MNDFIYIHLPNGRDLKIARRWANRQTGKELLEQCWKVYPEVKKEDRIYWNIRTAEIDRRKDEDFLIWLAPEKKLSEYNFKNCSFIFCPRIYPESLYTLHGALIVELLFYSVKRSIYDDELKFTDQAKDILAAYALQAYIGNYRSENDSRSALRRYYLVKIGRDLEYWAECEKRAVNHHKKMAQMPRGKAITNYLRTAQEQLTYGVQYHRGITDKADRAWVIGVCYRGLHRYQPGHLEQPEKVFDWKKLENLYYRDRKFSVEVSSEQSQGGVKQYSWYGPTKVIKALWHAAIHAHQFYLDRRQSAKNSSTKGFQKQVQDIEARLDQGQRINVDERLFSNQPEVQLISSVKEESPEKRARELEAMMMLKEKRKQLEDQYYQRVEQLKMILKKEAELTSIIPSDLRKYQNSDDDSWEAEMKNKKQIKSIQQTTFTNSNMKDQFQANSNSQNQPQIVLKMTRRSTDYALDELRRVEKDLEINLKITECLSKLNRHNHEKNEHSEKRRYIKRYQESLYHKYLKKIQSLEETKSSLEQLVRSTGYISKTPLADHKTRTAALLDDISSMPDTSKTSTSNSSSSLNIDHLDSHQNSSRSGAATPTSNRSTSSLLEESEASGLTRQYSLRQTRDNQSDRPIVTTTRAPSPDLSDELRPPVSERTTSLTPNLTRRVSQPLVDISAENITIRKPTTGRDPMGSSNGTSGVPIGTTTRGAVRPDHQNIHFTSKKEIESRYCKKHQTMRKQSSFDNSNNSNLNSEDSSFGFFHQGYGVMPKYPTPLDTLSESSFASDNPNFQNKFQIRQLLKDHFRDHLRDQPKVRPVSQLARLPRSRSNTSSAHLSTDSAFGTDVENAKSAPSTPGSSKRQIPTTLSLNPIQSNMDPGTPTSISSSTLHSTSSSIGYHPEYDPRIQDRSETATKRKEVRPDVFSSNTTGLRRALRRVQSQESALDNEWTMPEERGTLV